MRAMNSCNQCLQAAINQMSKTRMPNTDEIKCKCTAATTLSIKLCCLLENGQLKQTLFKSG